VPEGHTLHRLGRLHHRRFAGAPVVVTSPQGRFADGAKRVTGQVFARASVWGKHLFHHYAHGPIVHIHLGLYGTFAEQRTPMSEPVGQVRMRLLGADYGTDLRGPAACVVVDELQVADIIARLGPDPLRKDADPGLAWKRITKSRRSIGGLLLDQSVIAGVGNVYRAELLFRRGIAPQRPGASLDEAEFDSAWADLVALMKVGLRTGKIIVVRPEHDHGAPSYGPGKPRTYVYRRAGDPCRVCKETVRTAVMEGRNVFWCPGCQR